MQRILSAALLFLLASSLSGQEALSLWQPSQKSPGSWMELPADALSNAIVQVDSSLLAANKLLLLGDQTVLLGTPEKAFGGGWVTQAELIGDSDAEVLLAWNGSVVAASFRSSSRHFQLAWAGNGLHRVTELPTTSGFRCGTDLSHAINTPKPEAAPGGGGFWRRRDRRLLDRTFRRLRRARPVRRADPWPSRGAADGEEFLFRRYPHRADTGGLDAGVEVGVDVDRTP